MHLYYSTFISLVQKKEFTVFQRTFTVYNEVVLENQNITERCNLCPCNTFDKEQVQQGPKFTVFIRDTIITAVLLF